MINYNYLLYCNTMTGNGRNFFYKSRKIKSLFTKILFKRCDFLFQLIIPCIHCFIFILAFPLKTIAGQQPYRSTRNTSRFSEISDCFAG